MSKKLPGGLEGRSPPNTIRIRRHVRRIRALLRKASLRCFPPGRSERPRGKQRKLRKRTPQAGFFDTLSRPGLHRGGFLQRSFPGFLRRFLPAPSCLTGGNISTALPRKPPHRGRPACHRQSHPIPHTSAGPSGRGTPSPAGKLHRRYREPPC